LEIAEITTYYFQVNLHKPSGNVVEISKELSDQVNIS